MRRQRQAYVDERQMSLFDFLAVLQQADPSFKEELAAVSPQTFDDREDEDLEKIPFSSMEIELIHELLLKKSLRALTNKLTAESNWKEIFRWLMAPITEQAPSFSFHACCILQGVNADNFRDMVLDTLRRSGRLPKEMCH